MRKSRLVHLAGWFWAAAVIADHTRGTEDIYSGAAAVSAVVCFCTGMVLKELGR